MAGSRTRPSADPTRRVAVAASGGRDSTALLHCTARAARDQGVCVLALHVHHGLHPDADSWLDHLRRQCARWARAGLPVSLHVHRLSGRPAARDSVEAWARKERYRALAEMAAAHGCRIVLLAQHRRDQAETLLLQALRGGGPRGLAAMPAQAERAGLQWLRPWLDRPRESIEAYVARHRLSHVDDASNRDERFARNRLRKRVWPVLLRAFPDAEPALAQAAARAHEAAVCLQALAQQDALLAVAGDDLDRAAWLSLSGPRRANLLRHWLPAHPLPESLVRRLLDELPTAGASQWPAPGGQLHLHRGRLHWVPQRSGATPSHAPLVLDLGRPGRHELPSGLGCFTVRQVRRGGVAAERLSGASVSPRMGGEQFQIGSRGVPRSLKKQYQLRGVPAWDRSGPLVWAPDGALVYVPGLGVDARARAPEGTRQVTLDWEPAGGD